MRITDLKCGSCTRRYQGDVVKPSFKGRIYRRTVEELVYSLHLKENTYMMIR